MLQTVKNIIFDLGGVVLNIDPELSAVEFLKIFNIAGSLFEMNGEMQKILSQFEKGLLSNHEFHFKIIKQLGKELEYSVFEKAWNALILDYPPERIRFIESLRSRFRIFLLSNTNTLHYDYYNPIFAMQFGYKNLDSLFHQAFFSFNLKLCKPDQEIFKSIFKSTSIDPSETLFVDDSEIHINAARQLGIQTLLHPRNSGLEYVSEYLNI